MCVLQLERTRACAGGTYRASWKGLSCTLGTFTTPHCTTLHYTHTNILFLNHNYRETQLSKRVADWTSRLEPILRAQELAPEYDIHTYSDLVLTQVGSVPAMDLERRFQVLGLNSDENTGGVEEVRLTACREVIQTDRTIVDFQEIVGYRGQTKEPGQGQGQGWDQDHVGMGAGTGVGVGVGGSSAEVCRVFLACLMLANSGNLDLIPPLPVVEKKTLKSAQNDKFKDMEKGKDTGRDVFRSAKKEKYFSHNNNNQKMSFRVRLLDSKRNLDVEGFRAPSIDGKC